MIEHPLNISLNGNYDHIPWITGIVEHEGAVRAASKLTVSRKFNSMIRKCLAILTNPTLLDDLNSKFDELLPLIMELDVRNESNVEEIVRMLKEKYFNGRNVETIEDEQRLVDVNFSSINCVV